MIPHSSNHSVPTRHAMASVSIGTDGNNSIKLAAPPLNGLSTELSALRILILTAKDDTTHTREAYPHDALATVHWQSWGQTVAPMAWGCCRLYRPIPDLMQQSASP